MNGHMYITRTKPTKILIKRRKVVFYKGTIYNTTSILGAGMFGNMSSVSGLSVLGNMSHFLQGNFRPGKVSPHTFRFFFFKCLLLIITYFQNYI